MKSLQSVVVASSCKPSSSALMMMMSSSSKRCFSTKSSVISAPNRVSALSPEKFQEEMQKAGIQRGYVVYDAKENKTITSHPLFAELGEFITNDKRDFLKHEACFFQVGPKSNLLFGAFLHKSNRGIPHGGVRLWKYNSMEDYVRDGLRLSLGMTRKNALAGLWWGGGKGLIQKTDNTSINYSSDSFRDVVFSEYGQFLSSLKGAYYGAEDVGLTTIDCDRMHTKTRFVSCISSEIGGSGNPSHSTAIGTVCGMEAAVAFLGLGDLAGKKVVVQGAGNVASFIIEELLKRNVGKIVATDIDKNLIEKRKEQFKNANNIEWRVVAPNDLSVFSEPCDIFAPSALGGIINSTTIPLLNCKIVCGAANNQLLDPVEHDYMIKDRGIIYVPDYLNNRMGIVNCANECFGHVHNDEAILKHFGREWDNSVYVIATRILKNSKESNIPTGLAAHRLADEFSEMENPLIGHRGWAIVKGLINTHWENGKLQ
ncbi:hypothetical protein C9374_001471 [Naegleria lovaniensis]|uniref:Glutamate/phenylalanine/leucine/valine/L-tryptophan dehydrogenase C-terminal domain-containing protein n=1 Tax=Naegleria lovaniensis TaxID=51637 RepID=A0AA88GS47_NAELO|nr:uncharacterized protein C9374_001471 [Naegleria lovaniensis]KAG2387877.1 hypothetical protein C9374_001471 [Naegleria lovaniensis]